MGKVEEWSSIIENLDLWESFSAIISFLALEDDPEEKQWVDIPALRIMPKRKSTGAFLNYEAPFDYVLQKNLYNSNDLTDAGMLFSNIAFESRYKIEESLCGALEQYLPGAEQGVTYPVKVDEGVDESCYIHEKEAFEMFSEREKAIENVPLFNLQPIKGESAVMEEKGRGELFSQVNSLFEGPGKGKTEKILSTVKRDEGNTRVHEIKVEMAEHESNGADFDVDEMLEKMTERLCNMMAKGADGIYL